MHATPRVVLTREKVTGRMLTRYSLQVNSLPAPLSLSFLMHLDTSQYTPCNALQPGAQCIDGQLARIGGPRSSLAEICASSPDRLIKNAVAETMSLCFEIWPFPPIRLWAC